jgi:bacteriorhodopsin
MLLASKYVSFVIQIITGIIALYAITQTVPMQHLPIKQSLVLELIVQFVQILMYLWLIMKFHLLSMAKTRYIDWFITTPIMLLSLMLYFKYEAKKSDDEDTQNTLNDLFENNKGTIYIAIIANLIMLVFGILGEFEYISKTSSTIIGFVSLSVVFYVIWKDLASKSVIGSFVFLPFAIIWSLYGLAFNLDETSKNIFYNVLDVCAKNMFGLFLSYKVIYAKT